VAREIPERYAWAVEILDVRPDDLTLEIGCGYGHSIPLIAPKLSTGHLTLIDRSETMAAAAAKLGYEESAEEKVTVIRADLLSNNLQENSFDKILLFNINVFWMDPIAELTEIRRLLKPDGMFYLFHQPPPGHELEEFVSAFRANLAKYGFECKEILRNESEVVRSLCLIATPTTNHR